MTSTAITPVEVAPLIDRSAPLSNTLVQATPIQSTPPASAASFSQLLMNGIDGINQKQVDADNMLRAFALDDSIPVHQVTYALQQAKMSMELALQVRTRVLDAYQQLMNMQL